MKTVLKVLCVVFALASVGHLVAGQIWFAGIVLTAVCGYFGFRQKSEASPSEVATAKAVPDPFSLSEPSRPKPIAASKPPQVEPSAEPTQSLSPSGVFEIVKHASDTLVMERHELFKPRVPDEAEKAEAVLIASVLFLQEIDAQGLDDIVFAEAQRYFLDVMVKHDPSKRSWSEDDRYNFYVKRLHLIDNEVHEALKSGGRYMAPQLVYNMYVEPFGTETLSVSEMLDRGVHLPPLSMMFFQKLTALRDTISEVGPRVRTALLKERA